MTAPARGTTAPGGRPALDQIRLLFLTFSLGSALLLLALAVAATAQGHWPALLAAGLLVPLSARWVLEYRGTPARAWLDVTDAGALAVLAVSNGVAFSILILMYARVCRRALDVRPRHAGVIAAVYLLAFLAAVALTSPNSGVTPNSLPAVVLATGFALAPSVMYLFANTVRRLDVAMRNEHSLQAALLEQSGENFAQVFDAHPLPLWLHDPSTGRLLAVNDAAVSLYGYTREELLTLDVTEITGGHAPVDARTHLGADGRVIDVQCDVSRVIFREQDAELVLTRDVTEQRRMEERLEHNSLHDPLTGLANRVLFRQRIREASEGLRPDGRTGIAVIVLDLDGFKSVNDALGHSTGDRVLAITSARIAGCVKVNDTAARLGGDEFGIVLSGIDRPDAALRVAQRIVAAVRRPINISGRRLSISACCGVAVCAASAPPVEELVGDADIAMYSAKARGTGVAALFEPSLRAARMQRMSLERDLSAALAAGQITVVYQPQLDLGSGRVVGVEALARWHHPERGWVPPDEFIPVAEDLGIVAAIDEWVLRSALAALRGWSDEGLGNLRVAVNLSGQDLSRDDLAVTVRDALLTNRLDPWRLELELTETSAVAQSAVASRQFHELRAMGVRVAIDDFGTGFSMLSTLRDMPIDRLKIDRSFVTGLDRDDDAQTIVGSTIAMGHALGLDLCAEGVETAATAELLRTLGCDAAQGYLFARPLSADAVPTWVAERRENTGIVALTSSPATPLRLHRPSR